MSKDNFIDFNSHKEEIKNMINEVSIIDTNLGDFAQDEKTYYNDLKDKYIKNDIFDTDMKFMDKLSKGIDYENTVKRVKDIDPFNLSWKTYRIISFILILLSFFFLKFIKDTFIERGASGYILKIFNVISVLIIINLCIFLFYRTYFRYISTIKGSNGPRGKRGVKGIPGENQVCDTSKKKIATMYREKNRKPLKDLIDTRPDIVLDFDKKGEDKKGWYNIGVVEDSHKLLEPINNKIGVPCNVSNKICKFEEDYNEDGNSNSTFLSNLDNNKTNKIELNKLLTKNKPIIGASININKYNNAIQDIMFYSDKNKTHNSNRYRIKQFGKKSNKSGRLNISKNSLKENFQCPPNSAIYKVEGMYDDGGLKGLKFFCQDIKTGKSVKAYNMDNKQVYGVNFGVDTDPSNENYFYDKVECPVYTDTKDKNGNSRIYPTFISNIKESYNNKNMKSLVFKNCSYYREK